MNIAIYSRKSKFTGKGESIDNQVQMCKDYIMQHNKADHKYFIYEDEGFSGGNTNRPEFQRLMQDVKERKFNILICYRLDRISRNVADFSSTLEILQNNDVDFISIKEQFDTSTPMGRAMIYIASVFAQLERETIAERVRDNMLELSKTGRWLGGVAPLGYKGTPVTYFDENMNEKKMVKLKQVPEELKIVNLLYNKYLELKSLSKVETYCLQNNIKSKRGSNLTKTNIKIILNNPVYVKADKNVIEYLNNMGINTYGEVTNNCGLLTYNKQKSKKNNDGNITRIYRDTDEWIATVSSHKGIIDSKDWLEVQKILSDNKDTFPNEGKTHNALLTGKLRCKECGSNMQIAHGHISKKTGHKIYYYTCSMKKNSKGVRCNNKNAKVEEVDKVVINKLKEIGLDKTNFLSNLKKENKIEKKNNISEINIEKIKKSISDKEKQIDNLMNKLSIDDDITDLIIGKIKILKNEIIDLNKELENIKCKNNKYDEIDLNLSFIELLLNKCSAIDKLSIDEKKQLINALIDRIEWNGINSELSIDFIGSNDRELKKN